MKPYRARGTTFEEISGDDLDGVVDFSVTKDGLYFEITEACDYWASCSLTKEQARVWVAGLVAKIESMPDTASEKAA